MTPQTARLLRDLDAYLDAHYWTAIRRMKEAQAANDERLIYAFSTSSGELGMLHFWLKDWKEREDKKHSKGN